jgi:hypothetical protein
MKKTLYIIILALTVFTIACCKKTADENRDSEKIKCCRECLDAWGKSPAAIGPEGARCGSFMTAAKISESCKAYFAKQSITVSSCEKCAGKK